MAVVMDHLVVTVPDLEQAVADFEAATGVLPAPGGSHPGRGTRNALVRVSWDGDDQRYLELLGRDHQQEDVPPEDMMFDVAGSLDDPPRVHAWAVRPAGEDVEETMARGARAGLSMGSLVGGSRQTAQGEVIRWRMAWPRPLGLDRLQPFVVDWEGPHPTDGMPCRVTLDAFSLRHPEAEQVQDVLARTGVTLPVTHGPAAQLAVTLSGPAGSISY